MESEGTTLHISSYGSQRAALAEYYDIFVFNNDDLMRLDSYTRIDECDTDELLIASQAGEKRIYICANGQRDLYGWSHIESYHSLENTYMEIEREKINSPFMMAEHIVKAGDSIKESIGLAVLLSEIRLKSIRCDFSEKAYKGKCITDPKIYLININGQVSMNCNGPWIPERIVNHGRLDLEALSGFSNPDMIFKCMDEVICDRMLSPGISLFCYPNNPDKEGPGTPFTRLVIEGKIDDITYYWPISINRSPYGEGGISPGCIYEFDIVIKRKGSHDPDIPVEADESIINMSISKWTEKAEYNVSY